jgi:hypothetical protein
MFSYGRLLAISLLSILAGSFLPSGVRLARCLTEFLSRLTRHFSGFLCYPVSGLAHFAGCGISVFLPFGSGLV